MSTTLLNETIMTIDDKILNKIKKCLALSQSSEPHEAAAALRQAQKLMELHGVSMADIGRAEIGKGMVKSKASVSRIKDWELRLINMVTKAFGCKLLWLRSHSYSADVFGQCTLVGLKTQVKLAEYTCDVMQRKLMKARNQFVSDLPEYFTRAMKIREADGFCHGWVEAVSKTVHEFALTPEVSKLISDEADRISFGTAKAQQRQVGSYGLRAGLEAGAEESINRPVNGGEQQLQLGHAGA